MGEWLIYGSNGTQKATVKKLEYSGEFMGETSVSCDIYSPSPISFSIGDYLVYRGERFTIDYDATRLKQSRNNTYGKGYTYENMRFLSYVGELKKCEFLDFVPSDNLIHFSQLPDFSFYAETVKDLADRLQANLGRIYTGSKAWSVQVVQGFEGKENINVSVSKATCFDALRMAYDQFEATFIIRGRTITIGTAGNELETDFKYGKGNGLKTIERSVDESDSLVTRLRAYGNTTNLPANYYKNIGMRVYAPIYEIYHVSTTGCDIHFVPKLKNACFNDKNGQYSYWVTVSLDETLWLKAVASPNNHLSSTAYSVVTVGLYGSNTQAQVTQFLQQLQSGTYDNLYFKEGINVGAWPVEYREYAENVPNLMAIDRLMLPGFPELTTDPYIDASNISTLGVREKSVYFDGSDPDTPDIHPTLEGMTAAELRAAGYTIDLDAGDNGNLDEIAADATETDGSPITADGAFEGVDEVPGFKVTIKDIGFDINDYLSTETATLVMKTGMCGGREFTIVNVEKVGNKYVLECQRTEDVSHYFPYNPYLIKAGDKFVLTNIEMPKAYIDAASQRLLAAAQAYIAKYSAPQWVYAIKMDDIWMQRQRDNSESEASSYYWNIKEGDVMNVTDSDLGVDISEVIDRLTIREGYGPIPEFEVVLRKEKPQGTIGVLQNRIRQLELRNAEQVDIIRRQQNYIDLIIGDKLNTIQEQLDHVQVTYFGDYVPALNNEPASTWASSEYSEHDGDMFYNRTSGKGYEFTYKNGAWGWVEIQDEDIRQALEEAAAAQDTADGKRRVFVTPAGTLPTPPYDENDLWMNATYPSNSTSTDESQHEYYNDILKCITPRAEGGTASINDWSLGSKYTDDSSLNAFINGSYADDLEEIQYQIDGKAETWYQNTDPSTAWTTTALKNQHKGDIWHNSSNTTINGVKAGQDAIWNGTAWVVDETVPQSVYDTIDGKAAIYVSWGAWGNDLQVKDLFIPSANTTQGGVTYKANKVYRCTNKSTPTFQEIDYTDDAALNAFLNGYTGTLTGIRNDITNAATAASNAQTTANNANTAAAAAQATADALDYLKQAYLADNTLIDHGLILSTIVALRDSSNNVWSGISGAYDSTKLGNGIAAWYGGGMIDKEVSAVSNAAKSLFRFDGSGYVASGNLKWDANGNVTIQGYSINATTLQVGGSNVATQAMLDAFVSKAFFNRLFTAYDANGNAIVPNNTTTAINNLKIMVGAWTEQYLSALGLNSEGGGGGTGDVSHIKIGTNPDVFLDPDSDGIIDMSSYAANWNDAYNKRHTHSNKSVLDGITSTKVSHWDAVYGVVPSAAYETGNSLADKNFVNSSISTSTATFRGTNTTATTESAFLTWANGLTHDLNDYVFWSMKDSAGNTIYKRYKYDGSQWVFEYDLNNSSFTSDQWNAINSGITTSLVTKLNGIASGAQVNVIETVKVNGTALTVTSKAVDITAVPLTIITGADDLKAIEGLSGTSGFLKKTAANTWALDTTVVLSTRKVSTGNGLQGGGDLSADRTISVLLPANSGLSVASTGLKLDIVNNLTTASDYRAISATQAKKIWDLLNQMFTLEGSGTTASPYVIKANYGLYTEQFLSALGQNSQGGSGGGMGEDEMWAALQANSGTYENAKINWNHIPLATTSTAGAIKVGSTLAISNGILNQATIPNFIADVYTKVTVDTYGRVTQGGDLLADDIPTLSISKISGLSDALGNVYTKTESDAKYVTALGTSGNYLTYTKNGNSNSITVPYATTANSLKNLGRLTSADISHVTNGGVQYFLASGSMTEGKPANDGHILHFHWDSSTAWDSQLFISNNTEKKYIQYRAKNGNNGVWGSWITVLDTSNTSLSNGVININGSTITPLTAASNLAWSKVTGTPTTLSGYGITDAYTKTEADNKYVTIATAQTITGAKTFSDVITQNKGVLDNTPYQNLITLYSQNSTEPTGDAWDDTYPSYGIGFGRYWQSSGYGGVVSAGIYATVSGGWRSGLIFRTSNGGSSTTVTNNVNALRLAPSGKAYFSNDVELLKDTSSDTIIRASNNNGSIELLTSSNRGIYDRTGSTWLIATGGTHTFLSKGNVGIGTTSPSYKLHVNGTLGVVSGITLTTTKKIYFGDSSHYLELDANGYFHFSHGLYSDSFVSALGANNEGGGGGDVSLNAVWGSLTTYNDEYKDEVIDVHHIPNLSWAKITNRPTTLSGYGILDAYTKTQADAKYATISSLSDYATQTWVNQQGFVKSSGVTSVATGSGLTGGTITNTGTISIVSGFSTWNNTIATWGTLTAANGYTNALHWATSDGGDMTFAYKSGKISAQLDGYFYQNEGAYRVVDTSDLAAGKSWGMSITGNAATATKLGTSTVGSSVRPIYLNAGTPTVANVETTYLVEPSYANGVTPTTLQLINTTKPNRMVLLPPDQIIIEKTTDGGATWQDYGATDEQKRALFLGTSSNSANIIIPKIDGIKNKLCGIRITITGMKYNVPEGTTETQKYNYWNSNYVASTERYCTIQNMYFWVSAVNDTIRTCIYGATGANPTKWDRLSKTQNNYLTGWAGGNTIFTSNAYFGGYTNQTTNYWNMRIEFFTDGVNGGDLSQSSQSTSQYIYRIQGYGRNGWTLSNNLMAIDHLYNWDENQTAIFPYTIRPNTNNNGAIGASNYRWANVYATSGDFSSNVSLGGTLTTGRVIYMPNNGEIYIKDTNNNYKSILNFNGSNQVLIGYGAAGAGYSTTIDGNTIALRYGTSHTNGLTIDSNGSTTLAGDLYLQNAKRIFIKDNPTSGTASYKNVFDLSSSNNLRVGYGTSEAGYNTYIEGNQVYLTYGTSRTIGLTLYSNGDTALAGNLSLGNHKAIYAKDSNGSSKRIAILQSNNTLRFGIDTPESQYQTFIDGYDVLLRYGTSHTTGLTLNNTGQVIIPSTGSLKIGDATLSWDSTNQMLKVDKGFYSEGAVSALGSNEEGGGSSDFSEELMWAALRSNTGTYANAKIDANHIPDTSSLYGYLKSSSLSGYVNAVSTSGDGNAVTSVTKSGNTITFTKGSTFLTSHQTLYTLSIYGGTTKVLDFKPNANASIYIKAGGDISLTNDTTNKYITLSYTHPTNGANTTISAANGKVLSAITVNSLGHVTSVSSKTLASADIPDISATYATASRATTLEGYFTNGVANSATTATKLSTVSKTAWGQTYWTSGGVPTSISGNMSNVGNITMDGYLYMASQNRIYFKSSGNTDMIAMYETAANHLYIGYGFASEGYSTYIAGNTVELRYGTSRTTGLTLDGGDVTVKGKVCVGTGGADSYLASDSATNIYLRNSSGAILVCDGKVIRRSTASSLADVTLGNSSYPWGGVYSTTGNFSGNLTTSAIYTANGVYHYWKDSADADIAMISISSSNNAWLGYGLCPKGYQLRIGGGSIQFYYGTSRTAGMLFNDSGYLGVGNTNPSQRLHVTGNILASGEVTASSDERKKNIISNTKFNVRDIASARSIIYEWNDDRDKDNEKKIHGGSIAQDWLGKADSFLSQDNDGWYSINYGALALCSAITIARMTINHEDRLTRLEKENEMLKEKVRKLEERRVA